MDTLADFPSHQDAPGDPPPKNQAETDGEPWLGPAETAQIETAACGLHPTRRPAKNDWPLALAAAVVLHSLCIVALAARVTRFIPIPWHVARGDAVVSAGSSTPGQLLADDSQPAFPGIIPLPRHPSPLQSRDRSGDSSIDDSSALSDIPASPLAQVPDAVIGIGADQSSQRLPHFASSQPWLNRPSQVATAIPAGSAGHPAAGVTIPPRVAGSSGGRRGARDGCDSRGLPIPDYPAESRRRGEEGVVMVDVEVLANGRVGQIRIISDAGHPRLASAAVQALKSAAFDPARVDGIPAAGHLCIPYRFTLD